MEKLKQLPRECFYELEFTKKGKTTPNESIILTIVGLVLGIMGVGFAYTIMEASVALYISWAFVAIEVFLLVVLLILKYKNLYRSKLRMFGLIEAAVFKVLTFSVVPPVLSLYTAVDMPAIVIGLFLLLFPFGAGIQWFTMRKAVQAIEAGKCLPGGEGMLSKEFKRKYLPYIYIVTGLLEASRLTIIIWTRLATNFYGNIVPVVIFPFVAVVWVVILSYASAFVDLDAYMYWLYPDWGQVQRLDGPRR